MVDGDGCETDCRLTAVSESVAAGETVTSDVANAGTSAQIPIVSSVTTPNAGEVAIQSVPNPLTTGFQVVGVQLDITAPPASAAVPLSLTFRVDASAIPAGTDAARLEVLRDGVPVGDCTGAPGEASPDPCVSSRVVSMGGSVDVTVLSSHASTWSVIVRAMSRAEQSCVNKLGAAGGKVSSAQSGDGAACLKGAAAGDQANADACAVADAKGKVAKAQAKAAAIDTDACSPAPPFAYQGAAAVNAAAEGETLALLHDLFGPNLTAAVISSDSNRLGATCQSSVAKATQKLLATEIKGYLKCARAGLSGHSTLIVAQGQLGRCLSETQIDGSGKVAKAVAKLVAATTDRCHAVDLNQAFPGICAGKSLVACARAAVECRLCRIHNAANAIGFDCDGFDDGSTNGSCP